MMTVTPTRDLWAEFVDLPAPAAAYLTGMLAGHTLAADPDRFARYIDEAKAVAS
jgi:hypothetical protein